jgi:carbon storage regulator
VLTRRAGESVQIGDDVTVHVVGVGGGRVRLMIVAPKEVKILRTEIIDKPREAKA